MCYYEDLLKSPHSSFKLAIETKNENWDIYINDTGVALSIAKVSGAKSSMFGDVNHIKRLMNQGFFNNYECFTDFGLKMMSGIHSKLCFDSKSKRFIIVSF